MLTLGILLLAVLTFVAAWIAGTGLFAVLVILT
jgi:hypothetical protein